MNFQEKINIYHRLECGQANGLCVVIDVLRAFTTAAFAFAKGAQEIILVAEPEDAFRKLSNDRSLILMGEQEGNPIEGFHYGNSPTEISEVSLEGRRLVQRTSSGTQGVVVCPQASFMLISSFVVAEATLKRIVEINPPSVSFIVTGRKNGDEDYALAQYLQKRLLGETVQAQPFLERVLTSPAAARMLTADPKNYKFGKEDLKLSVQIDRFPFAMEVFQSSSGFTARKHLSM
ncbi:MAG: 2-phosphosulfolactate phosphatase [Parachlamydia sp.]|nr:MAG: 2-phosphosulfolactate phosphatase [Parachlamydia sp.]